MSSNEITIDRQSYYEDIYRSVRDDDRELFRSLFLKLHDRDQHEVFHLLYPEKKRKIADLLTPEEFAMIFEWMVVEDQEAAITYLSHDFIQQVLSFLPADVIANLIHDAETLESETIYDLLEPTQRDLVRELLSYEEETAGAIMIKEYLTVSPEDTLKQVIAYVRAKGHQAGTIYYIYVLDKQHHLLGVLSMRDLILSPENELVKNVMFEQVITVPITMDQEEVAKVIQNYDLLAVPVITPDNKMRGIITFDDVMDVLEEEATEDLISFAGVPRSSVEDKEPTVLETTKKRTPWIIVLIFLGLMVGGLISIFHETLESVIALSAFIPLITGTGGNVGTQALAVTVRDLNLGGAEIGQKIWQTVKNEFGSGILIGFISSLVLFGVLNILKVEFVLTVIVSIAIFLTICFSAVTGAIMPIILTKLKVDPAVASGPFISTIIDALGLMIYFLIATSLLEQI
ncbi:MAG TPA: magnesium transporter [Clostridiaceae bacterium]|nr:magnesium transporter [Clostridiaceae bacterium]